MGLNKWKIHDHAQHTWFPCMLMLETFWLSCIMKTHNIKWCVSVLMGFKLIPSGWSEISYHKRSKYLPPCYNKHTCASLWSCIYCCIMNCYNTPRSSMYEHCRNSQELCMDMGWWQRSDKCLYCGFSLLMFHPQEWRLPAVSETSSNVSCS